MCPHNSYKTTSTMCINCSSEPGKEFMELEELLGFDKSIFNVLHIKK